MLDAFAWLLANKMQCQNTQTKTGDLSQVCVAMHLCQQLQL